MKQIIYIIEDDVDIAELIEFNLESEGFKTKIESNGLKAYEMIVENPPDLLLLDLNLPGISGIEICKYLREQNLLKDLPVIMLTARSQETDKVRGLNIGADDYITKPFSMKELIARINALLRRSQPTTSDIVEIGGLEVNFALRQVRCNNEIINTTPTEYKLLKALIQAKGRILSRGDLLDFVWGSGYSGEERKVDVNIKRLRDKMGNIKELIQTVKSIGYRIDFK